MTQQGIINAIISAAGGGQSTPTPTPTTSPTAGPGACRAVSAVSAWNTGLTNSITNTGTTVINGWTLAFTPATGQTIVSGWSASYAPASGTVAATNASYNGTLAPGGSTTIGYQANHTGNAAALTDLRLNGAACG